MSRINMCVFICVLFLCVCVCVCMFFFLTSLDLSFRVTLTLYYFYYYNISLTSSLYFMPELMRGSVRMLLEGRAAECQSSLFLSLRSGWLQWHLFTLAWLPAAVLWDTTWFVLLAGEKVPPYWFIGRLTIDWLIISVVWILHARPDLYEQR